MTKELEHQLRLERSRVDKRADELVVFLYHYDSIYTEIRLINKTQLDAMTTVTDQRGATTSVGQSNRISYCPMCGRKLND